MVAPQPVAENPAVENPVFKLELHEKKQIRSCHIRDAASGGTCHQCVESKSVSAPFRSAIHDFLPCMWVRGNGGESDRY